MVCRDHEGMVLAYATKFHNLGVPQKIVEALCMCWASQMAQDLCLQNCDGNWFFTASPSLGQQKQKAYHPF